MFRGTEVRLIGAVEVAGKDGGNAQVAFTVAFVDEGGVVHATSRHKISVEAAAEVQEAVRVLISTLEAYARRAHFTDESVTQEFPKQHGISESFPSAPDPSDRVAGQGSGPR